MIFINLPIKNHNINFYRALILFWVMVIRYAVIIRPFKEVFFLLLLLSFFILSSCNKSESDLIPSYIHVDSVQLVSNPEIVTLEGSLSHNITDVWVYVDEEFIGAFEVPVTFPVLKEGIHTLKIKPGVLINGISTVRGEYPFYEPYTKDVNFVGDSIIVISPKVKYKDFTVFKWVEDFEDNNSSLIKSSRSDTSVVVTSDPIHVFEGNYSGIIHMDELRFFFECLTSEAYELPRTGEDVFLEMNFKTNNSVTVGLFVNTYNESFQTPVVILNKTGEWKKIYINLINAVNSNQFAVNYNIFLGAMKDEGVSDPEIIIDNLKLIH